MRYADFVKKAKEEDSGNWLTQHRDWIAGGVAGTGAGLTAYALSEFVPQLKRQRAIRLLIGALTGAGVGIGTKFIVGK